MAQQAPSTKTPQRLFKITACHNRNPNVTHEEYIKWYEEQQIPLSIKLIQKHGIVRFSVVSITIFS